MTTRAAIVDEARSWLGTPFVHQAMLKGVGADCAGVVAGVANGTGIATYRPPPYRRQPDPQMMRAEIEKHMDPVPFAGLMPGDVVWFVLISEPQHLAIVTALEPMTMVHAWGRKKVMRCVEESVKAFLRRARVDSCWRYRGLD